MTTERLTSDTDTSISGVIVACLAEPANASRFEADAVTEAGALILEALGVHAHWDTTNPTAAKAIVRGHMRRRHGYLTDEALEALAVHSTRDFRC